MNENKRRRYNAEFKRNAIALSKEPESKSAIDP